MEGIRALHRSYIENMLVECKVELALAKRAAVYLDTVAIYKTRHAPTIYPAYVKALADKVCLWIKTKGILSFEAAKDLWEKMWSDEIWKYDLRSVKVVQSIHEQVSSFVWYTHALKLEREQDMCRSHTGFEIFNCGTNHHMSLVERGDPFALRFFSIYPQDYVRRITWDLYAKSVMRLFQNCTNHNVALYEKLGTCFFFGIGCKQSYNQAATYFVHAGASTMVGNCAPRGDPTGKQMSDVVLRIMIDYATRPMLNSRNFVLSLRLVCCKWNYAILKCGNFWTRHAGSVNVSLVSYDERSKAIFRFHAQKVCKEMNTEIEAREKLLVGAKRELEKAHKKSTQV